MPLTAAAANMNLTPPSPLPFSSTQGATLVFVTHTFLFPGVDYKVINGVDFEVLILLAG
jgi:hypothetical protein